MTYKMDADTNLLIEALVTLRGQLTEDLSYFDDYSEEDRAEMEKKLTDCLRLEAKLSHQS